MIILEIVYQEGNIFYEHGCKFTVEDSEINAILH